MGNSVDKGDLSLEVLFPSNYIRAADLRGKPVTVTITGAILDAVPMTGGRKEKKLVFSMAKTRKQFIAGKTNGYCLALLLCSLKDGSPNLREVVGKRVTFIADVDTMKGVDVAAIRIQGSPDAAPDRAAAYASAWRGERKRGALVGRVKRALGLIAMGQPPPVEQEESFQDQSSPDAPADQEEDMFANTDAPPKDGDGESNPHAGFLPPDNTATRQPGED